MAGLSEDGLDVETKPKVVLEPIGEEGTGYQSVVEGPIVVTRGGLVYLLYSGDRCCGPDAHYAMSAAVSRSPLGPFRRCPANPFLAANSAFSAPGHCSVVDVSGGRTWLVYHAMRRGGTEDRLLMLDELTWAGDWPVVNGGAGPSAGRFPAPQV